MADDLCSGLMRCSFWIAISLALCACRTTEHSRPAFNSTAVVMHASPVRAWLLWEEGQRIGSLVRYESTVDAGQAYFSVRNRHEQEVGIVDLFGRAWRYRPHQDEPEWLGTSTISSAVRSILETGVSAELREIELSSLVIEAAHGR
jgi:hypothetical protein